MVHSIPSRKSFFNKVHTGNLITTLYKVMFPMLIEYENMKAEEIRRMHEEGQLEKMVEGCEMLDDGGGGGVGGACEACGDIRFVPCETCSGSCKIYYECDDEEQEELEEEEESGEYGFQRCPDCNENGLIRCPICCD
ncbi:unnamed protein product [Dovyalis caffra]|uniref:Uncharacterized protein n=1 Tax=Dovyalis caffra TaxID=77055 RepID=A0AAV1RI20_9ROSI|nr:unnamed protein product [Dovyalis caffra]